MDVLIVAECNVNTDKLRLYSYETSVLIVAECNVNTQKIFLKGWLNRF